jgi:hypothetical protein
VKRPDDASCATPVAESWEQTYTGGFYWGRYPDGPFATLIRIARTSLHPEADDFESLQRLAERDGDEAMRTFKAELRATVNDPEVVPGGELSRHVQYEDGSPAAFLRRQWRDLFGDEPPEAPRGLLAPDPELRDLSTDRLLAMASGTSESVLRRGRAMIELGRPASGT